MANICDNYLKITGSKEDIERLEKFIKSSDKEEEEKWDLTKIIPVEVDDEGYYKCDNIYNVWGTKWISDVWFKNHGNSAILHFSTAWSPSLPITLEMSKKFNLTINHSYEESGCDFEGDYAVSSGEVFLNEQRDYRPACQDCGDKFDRDDLIYDEAEGSRHCRKCGDELTGIVAEKLEKIKKEKQKAKY